MTNTVTVDVNAHVASVVLNRPDKMNAVNLDMFAELSALGERIASDRGIRAVVVSGAGDNFCAGIDTSIFAAGQAIGGKMMVPQEASPANLFQRAAWVWRELPIPVICAIHGAAFGAGLQIALGADIRYASPAAKLAIMESKWGLIPDMAITVTARDVIPLDRIKELAYTARVVLAEEALQLGLITQMHDDPLAAAEATAAAIASKSPDAVRAMKTLFDEAWSAPVDVALAREAELQIGVMSGANQREAVLANIEKRSPEFSD